MIGPSDPHRLHGLAPFPYFLSLLTFCFPIVQRLLHDFHSKRILDECHGLLTCQNMFGAYLGLTFPSILDSVSRTSDRNADIHPKYSYFGVIFYTGQLDVFFHAKRKVALPVAASP